MFGFSVALHSQNFDTCLKKGLVIEKVIFVLMPFFNSIKK